MQEDFFHSPDARARFFNERAHSYTIAKKEKEKGGSDQIPNFNSNSGHEWKCFRKRLFHFLFP